MASLDPHHPHPFRQRLARLRISPWSLGALMIAAIVMAPILSVVVIALTPGDNIWPHLLATTLPRYMRNTLVLMLSVGLLSGLVGTTVAWLISRYRFPMSGWLEWLLLLPLAIPAYVGAYALVDLFEYSGPVQSWLRGTMGWTSPRDYWFPQIRSQGAAILVLTAALYPYVYLLARAAFREQSGASEEVARSLGQGPFGRFRRVGLPLARPAIAAGIAIVMMETVNDFGTVDFFAVQTLTTGIFSVWLDGGNPAGAAQIASTILVLVVMLILLERLSRRRLRFFSTGRPPRPVTRQPLRGLRGWLATLICLVPFAIGFVMPTAVIGWHASRSAIRWSDPELLRALGNTLTVGGAAAVVTVLAAVFMVYAVRLSGRRLPRLAMPVSTIGYAAPGAVLGVGLLIPLARLDHALADGIEALSGHDIGLILTGSAFALVLAYTVRFFAIAQGAADAAMERISPSLPMAARSLGRSRGQVLREVHFPLIRASIGSALLLVFVDCVKELPATLLLRPFNYNTLATRVHEKASLENLADAAPAAMLIILVGLAAVGLLARTSR